MFGQRLRELRRGLKLSQEETAHRARLHVTYLSDLERGMQTPTLDVVRLASTGRLCAAAEMGSFLWLEECDSEPNRASR